MTTAVAIAAVLILLVAVNLWVHVGPTGWHLMTGPLAALLALLVARWAGLTWLELGLGQQTLLRGTQVAVACILAVGLVYAAGVAIPFTRAAFRDTRYHLGVRTALYMSLVVIPLATVLFEEVAFRSVLWGLLAHDYGVPLATVVSAGLFGLWHVLPAMDLARTHTSVRGQTVAGGRRVAITVLATIAFTTIAGIAFAELRRRSGSLVAPIGLHWATNGLGVLAAARVWAVSPGNAATPGEVATGDTTGVLESLNQPAWQRALRRLSSRS
jgi:membrane protease YdiL (CAAX protease family)